MIEESLLRYVYAALQPSVRKSLEGLVNIGEAATIGTIVAVVQDIAHDSLTLEGAQAIHACRWAIRELANLVAANFASVWVSEFQNCKRRPAYDLVRDKVRSEVYIALDNSCTSSQ